MTDLRKAAQQALEAMIEHGSPYLGHESAYQSAITALRTVLAEPQTTHWEGCEAVHPECKKENT